MLKTVIMKASLIAFVTSISFAVHAIADTQRFDVPAGDLIVALESFAKQADVDLVYQDEQVKGLRTGGVTGELSPHDAVIKLLEGTPLNVRRDDASGAMLITAAVRAAPARTNQQTTDTGLPRPQHLAQADTGPARRAQRERNEEKETQPGSVQNVSALPEIVVTGSRLRGTNEDGPSPVTSFNRAKIEQLGVSTVADLLKYVPQQPFTRRIGVHPGGAQFAELRGLGIDTTLILINGRRTIPSAASSDRNAFDLNTIPLAAVERIEVLSDSASAVYGADAVGGVINIILKTDLDQLVLDLNYGASQGGGEERRLSISHGYSGDRFRGSVVLDYFDRLSLLGAERDIWRDQDYRRYGGLDQRSRNANPGTISSRTAGNLPGLSAPFAAVPVGSTGVGLTPASFVPTAGQRNLESLNRFTTIVPEGDRKSAALSAEFDFRAATTAFGEFLFTERTNDAQSAPSVLRAARVPATNPFNPFGIDVSADYLFEGVGPQHSITESELYRSVLGLRGQAWSWGWEISFLDTREDSESWTQNSVDPTRATLALGATDPTQSLNVFQDGPGGSRQLLDSLILPPDVRRSSADGTQVGLTLTSTLWNLPAGAIQFALGGENRTEDVTFRDFVSTVQHDRDASAAFAEVRVPVTDKSDAVGDIQLSIAARYDSYSDFGSTFNPQYGLTWAPLDGLLLRASYGTSFRPPSLFELYTPRSTTAFTVPVTDPRRNGETANVNLITGGNPDLDPVQAESFIAGFVITPDDAKNIRISSSYWRIRMEDRVSVLPFALLPSLEGRFPERIRRATPTPADVAAGLPGIMTTVDISRINFGVLETSGVDVDALYAIGTRYGRVTWTSSATWVNKYESADVPNTPPVDRVGVAYSVGTIPRWRATAGMSWSHAGLQLSTNVRYVPSYKDSTLILGVDTPNGDDVPSQILVDLQGSWALDGFTSTWARGMKLSAGVSNIFDEAPPFAAVSITAGFDQSQGDLRQRFAYVNLSKTF